MSWSWRLLQTHPARWLSCLHLGAGRFHNSFDASGAIGDAIVPLLKFRDEVGREFSHVWAISSMDSILLGSSNHTKFIAIVPSQHAEESIAKTVSVCSGLGVGLISMQKL
ncbi:hypothetical protein GOP47_0023757 [Adiantum capillus-veneris]|uniref:Uncharacterized protein n=1 Tax=Adiantum capillus-veneris TaxID=13818 RepID=A0A9D4Z5F8_ADICA|nr:hypothetical protein GOP47_0023757 [Adiantum capillus-veneris]